MNSIDRFINPNDIETSINSFHDDHVSFPLQCKLESKNLQRYLEYLQLKTKVETFCIQSPSHYHAKLGKTINPKIENDTITLNTNTENANPLYLIRMDSFIDEKFIEALKIALERIELKVLTEQYTYFGLYAIFLKIQDHSTMENLVFDVNIRMYGE